MVGVVQRELLTPYGLRTLTPRDPRYQGYEGDPAHSDRLQPSCYFAYGTALWLFAQAIAVRVLGALAGLVHGLGDASPGPFAARLGAGGALGSLFAHLAYGGVLGFVYGCLFRVRCLSGARPLQR